MSAQDWRRTVFRLRRLPNTLSTPADVASLLSGILGLPSDDVAVYSVAKTCDIWEVPPSKVATLQFRTLPACLKDRLADNEWLLPTPQDKGDGTAEVLILDTHFEGLTVLYDPIHTQHSADCIAISGLASHPFGSWQPRGDDKTFMWIRDAIPASLPGVRTMVYGYDSKLLHSRSFQSISDIARGLVLYLKSCGWNLPSSKPIVFLAHSLGGLVLKDAIVQMADRDESIAGILDNICGAIMFGVPSLGMEQSHLVAMVEGHANEFLVHDLSRGGGGNYVRQLHAKFDGLSFLRRARIFWAYETIESPTVVQRPDGSWDRLGPCRVLVDPDSATCHNNRKNKAATIPIHKDHSNMVKFTRGDTCFGIIAVSIAEISSTQLTDSLASKVHGSHSLTEIEEAPLAADSNTRDDLPETYLSESFTSLEDYMALKDLDELMSALEELHRELYSPELDFRVDSIEDPFQNTFNWIFELPLFSDWLQEGSGLFYIHGKPGSGKSTLMKLIVRSRQTYELLHNWRRGSMEIIVGIFFHYRGSALQKSFEGVLRGLILQILAPHRDLLRKRQQRTWEEFKFAKEKLFKLRSSIAKNRAALNQISKLLEQARKTPGKTPAGQKLHRPELKYLVSRQLRLKTDLQRDEEKVVSTRHILAELGRVFRPHRSAPETTRRLLKNVIAAYLFDQNGLMSRLENILRQLLDQNIVDMDLVLFIDALDEFDGHHGMIGRFIESLLKSPPGSKTRVKVCLSSRPWESLISRFSSCPGFSLQDHTKHDIEYYAVGSITSSSLADQSVLSLVPTITGRANGVFLWVKLAVAELLESAVLGPESVPLDSLEKRLQELPGDLCEFYELILERISQRNRRRTFALLELLGRHKGPPVEAYELQDAVLISDSKTFDEAVEILDASTSTELGEERWKACDKSAREDIYTWGGGLVEIKVQFGVLLPQLMHQTVLEFIMGLRFKEMVVGELATILHENGHSFHLKYLLFKRISAIPYTFSPSQWPVESYVRASGSVPGTVLTGGEQGFELLAYHAEQAELTTGKSQLAFIFSAPHGKAALYNGYVIGQTWSHNFNFVSLIASFGLTLCLRDWARGPEGNIGSLCDHTPHWPLLTSLIFSHPSGVFHERRIATARLLLENGFKIKQDPQFFPKLLGEIWKAPSHQYEQANRWVPSVHLHTLAKLALEHGQDPNIGLNLDKLGMDVMWCKPLHIASPLVAAELIRHGADPLARDSQGHIPLAWVLGHPSRQPTDSRLDCAERYEICKILAQAGGVDPRRMPIAGSFEHSLREFEAEGYDTSLLRQAGLVKGWEDGLRLLLVVAESNAEPVSGQDTSLVGRSGQESERSVGKRRRLDGD